MSVVAAAVRYQPEQVVAETVRAVEPQLAAEKVAAILMATIKRRPERRRLAEVLNTTPDLFTSGRPEAPRSIARLITALREHGAVHLKAPECAQCGAQKPLTGLMDGLRVCAYCKIRQIQRSSSCGSGFPRLWLHGATARPVRAANGPRLHPDVRLGLFGQALVHPGREGDALRPRPSSASLMRSHPLGVGGGCGALA
ncbi:hypothetical protein ACH492_36660 [Streptomyces sp. NPDC019443]|uniref:hypothetical protein n=1 Tax=Streptomyces sp. NPDC019443 TaxID=3365061 RepID=UPI00379CFAE0